MKFPKKVTEHICKWLDNYLVQSQMKGFVVGISGGVDSAVTSTLCALTGHPVLCLEMPIRQDVNQVNRAQEHMTWLRNQFPNVTALQIPLDSVFDAFENQLPQAKNESSHLLSLANTRARLRMTTLYYFAALHRYLVVGTGNKVEDFGVGFYTKYGDGGVDISPIADLNKTAVFTLSKHLSIINSIQNAAPTDGLWVDNRTDEDQIGATYPELEWAMIEHKNGSSPDTFNDRQKEVFEIFTRFHKQNLHKMNPIPVCIIPEKML